MHAGPRGSLVQRLARTAVLPWRTNAKVVMTVDPDMIPITRLVTTLRRRKMVADVHEDYRRLLADRAWAKGPAGLPARLIVRASSKLAAGADLTVVADSYLATAPGEAPAGRPELPVHPVPRPRTAHRVRRARCTSGTCGPAVACSTWSRPSPRRRTGRSTWSARSHRRTGSGSKPGSREADLAGRVRLHGRQPPADAWRLTKGAWASLAMLQPTPAFVEAMPSKIYEYLASGLPVLSTRLPRQTKVIEESGGGVLVDSVAEASETLRRWSADPGELEKLRDHALRVGGRPSAHDDAVRRTGRRDSSTC